MGHIAIKLRISAAAHSRTIRPVQPAAPAPEAGVLVFGGSHDDDVLPHWRDAPERVWRWPNFSPAEIACRGTGKLLVNEQALDKLQALRERLGKPLIVRSAYRSPEHNRAVGGAKRSKHMEGTAIDIVMPNHDPVAFEAAAREVGFLGFGFYLRSGFMHIDLGPAREWGERFPPRATVIGQIRSTALLRCSRENS